MCSDHFPRGGRSSTLSSEGSPHEASQSGHDGGQKISTSASHRDQDGGGGADLYYRSNVKDGSSIKAQLVDRSTSSLLKTELIPGLHGMSSSIS